MPSVFGSLLGPLAAVGSLVFWYLVATRGEKRARAWVERRYGVNITTGSRGMWIVRGPGSWLKRFALGWIQLGVFLGAMVVWAAAIMGVLLVMSRFGTN